jgi:hypothetical protein
MHAARRAPPQPPSQRCTTQRGILHRSRGEGLERHYCCLSPVFHPLFNPHHALQHLSDIAIFEAVNKTLVSALNSIDGGAALHGAHTPLSAHISAAGALLRRYLDQPHIRSSPEKQHEIMQLVLLIDHSLVSSLSVSLPIITSRMSF